MADGRQRHAQGPPQPVRTSRGWRLAELLPGDVKVCVVADRGFGDQKLWVLTEELCFDYVIPSAATLP